MKKTIKTTLIALVLAILCACTLSSFAPAGGNYLAEVGSIGTGVGESTTLVDFSSGDLCGFEALGNVTALTFERSSAWNAPVLYTWLDSANEETGIRGTLDTARMQNASTLSVSLLAQYKNAGSSYQITLRLEGISKAGTPLVLEAHANPATGNWQTVTFPIAEYLREANPDAPTTVTLLTDSSATTTEQFVLWVHSFSINTPTAQPEWILPVASATLGFVVGFSLFYIIYRATCSKKRQNRGY